MLKPLTRLSVLTLTAGLLALTPANTATSAEGDVELGNPVTPAESCGGPFTYLQTGSLNDTHTVPSDGVITSWRYRAAGAPEGVGFRLGRPTQDPAGYSIVGASENVAPPADELFEQNVRIPAKAGDVLGMYWGRNAGGAGCVVFTSAQEDTYIVQFGDVTDGPFAGGGGPGVQAAIGATLEPDADADGYGDSTQDLCPTQADTQDECVVAPDPTPAPAATPVAVGSPMFVPATAPTAIGTVKVGKQIRALGAARRNFTPTPTDVKVRWFANGNKIKGAKKVTYTVRAGDVGKKLKAVVTVIGPAPKVKFTAKTRTVRP